MIMLTVLGNRREWKCSSHFCQVEVENCHNTAFIEGEKQITHEIFK